MGKILFTVLLLVFLTQPCLSSPQEINSDWLELLSNQPVRYSHWIDLDGCHIFRQYPGSGKTKHQLTEFFLHTAVADELNLSTNKRQEIEAAFTLFHNSSEDKNAPSKKQSPGFGGRRTESSSRDDLRLANTIALTGRLNELLTREQKRRIYQLHLRFLIHQNGFFQTLCNKAVANQLKITLLDREKLIEAQHEIAKEVVRRSRSIANDAFAEWISELSEKEQKTIKKRWGKMLESHALQQLIFQLNSNVERSDFAPEYKFDLTQNWPQFDHDVAGQCVKQKNSESGSRHTALGKFNWLHSMVFSKHFQKDIELVGPQIAEIKTLAEEFRLAKSEVNCKVGKQFDVEPRVLGLPSANGKPEARIVYTLTTPEQLAEFEKEMAPIARAYYSAYLEVFLPHQNELIDQVVANINTRLQGPLAELLWGDLGKALKLSDDDKELLKSKADEIRSKLEIECKKIYDDSMTQLIELANEENRQKIRTVLGEEISSLCPNLDGFAAAQFSNR